MKAGIDLMSRKLASSEYSHQSSWAHLRANQLRNLGVDVKVLDDDVPRHSRDWSEYDTIFIYHGMDFHEARAGYVQALNVFDGMVEHAAKFYERLAWPQHDHITYISLDYNMPDYGQLCKVKKGTQSDYWRGCDWDKVSQRCQNVQVVMEPAMHYAPGKVRHLVIGDSHAHSAYKANSMCLRKDGRTLNGVIKKGIAKEITDHDLILADIDSLTCYWGNIDIRHHIYREADPIGYTKDLLKRYEIELQKLNRPIELVTPVPIEDETRRIPTTGNFKGTPFTGTRAERMVLVDMFKDAFSDMVARNSGWSLHAWPETWYKMDGIEFMQTFLERPRSVHLARKFYRWDLVNNVPNAYFGQTLKQPVSSLLQF
jgi:hypothetical protein